jgi:hypothetical protein
MDQIDQTLSAEVKCLYVRKLYILCNGQTKDHGFSYWHRQANSLYRTRDLSYRKVPVPECNPAAVQKATNRMGGDNTGIRIFLDTV